MDKDIEARKRAVTNYTLSGLEQNKAEMQAMNIQVVRDLNKAIERMHGENISASKQSSKLGKVMTWLTLATAFLALVQIIIAILGIVVAS